MTGFESLAFLPCREKLLAGSWQYLVIRVLAYFGRDTLLALRLSAPLASADLFDAGLGAVLDRIAPSGGVAHEETLGEYALLDRERRRRRTRLSGTDGPKGLVREWGTGPSAPILDDKMVDDDILLSPVLATYLLEVASPDQAAGFLGGNGGRFLVSVRANCVDQPSRWSPTVPARMPRRALRPTSFDCGPEYRSARGEIAPMASVAGTCRTTSMLHSFRPRSTPRPGCGRRHRSDQTRYVPPMPAHSPRRGQERRVTLTSPSTAQPPAIRSQTMSLRVNCEMRMWRSTRLVTGSGSPPRP